MGDADHGLRWIAVGDRRFTRGYSLAPLRGGACIGDSLGPAWGVADCDGCRWQRL